MASRCWPRSRLLAGCERPPVDTVQRGYRGTGMELVYNPRTAAQASPRANQAPPVTEPAGDARAEGQGRLQERASCWATWASPSSRASWRRSPNGCRREEGCNYCHDPANMGDDTKYTKVVARRMIQMTQHINADWKPHVAATGVTCYTCHRGNAVPQQVWFKAPPQDLKANFIGDRAGQNAPTKMVGLSSLPYDPFSLYLLGDQTIGVGGPTALPTGPRARRSCRPRRPTG